MLLAFTVCLCIANALEVASGTENTDSAAPAPPAAVASVDFFRRTQFPENMLGVWYPKPHVPLKSALGPLSYDFAAFHAGGLTALRDPGTGDVWWTLLIGQVFHLRGNQMQYCFGELGLVFEQAPFTLNSMSETEITFCWRTGLSAFPTHPRNCSGCDCAKIHMELTDSDTLNFRFYQSPPVIHANFTFRRTTRHQPSIYKAIWTTTVFPYQQCTWRDHFGPNIPGMPDLKNRRRRTGKTSLQLPGGSGGCMRAASTALSKVAGEAHVAPLVKQALASVDQVDTKAGSCHQLNAINLMFNSLAIPGQGMPIPDVRVQYRKSTRSCNPCLVSYSVSAKIKEDEYISIGFKGQSWEHKEPYPPEIPRPCYFGMCVDSYDNFTSDRIALGYASSSHGSCVREMVSKDYVGTPVDVDSKIFSQTSVERAGDRTIFRFTISQHWLVPTDPILPDGPYRLMWAIGKVSGNSGCAADIGYHAANRGVSPLKWLVILGALPCTFSPFEMGDSLIDRVNLGAEEDSTVVV